MEAEKPKEEWSAVQATKIALQWKLLFLHLWEKREELNMISAEEGTWLEEM